MQVPDDDAALKRAAAAYLGRKGGLARAKNLTKAQLSAIGKLGAKAKRRKRRLAA